jgi:hypothetical protein
MEKMSDAYKLLVGKISKEEPTSETRVRNEI